MQTALLSHVLVRMSVEMMLAQCGIFRTAFVGVAVCIFVVVVSVG